jgi:FixJ family two-component response regulator
MAFECAEDFLNSDQRRDASCLVADVQMPDMTGPELYDRLIASGERIPTIFIIAYPDSIARTRTLQDGAIGCLTKPFFEDDFLACIDRAIAASETKGESGRLHEG